MIRTLLTTTSMVALLAIPAFAQDAPAATTPAPAATTTTTTSTDTLLTGGYALASTDQLASRAMGAKVYSSAAQDAEEIGTVKDLVLGDDGTISAAVLAVGGFLGVGEKNVAVSFADLKWTKAADNTWRYVMGITKDALTAAPDFVWPADENNTAIAPAVAPADNNTAMAPANNNAATPANNNTAMAPADNTTAMAPATAADANGVTYDRAAMQPMDLASMKVDDLKGAPVIGQDNHEIARISDLVLTQDGKVDAVIVDVGGFLGLGSKPVAVAFNAANFAIGQDGKPVLFIGNVTKDQLNAQPSYNKDTYTAERQTQRLAISP